jgi:hypothetical protein
LDAAESRWLPVNAIKDGENVEKMDLTDGRKAL